MPPNAAAEAAHAAAHITPAGLPPAREPPHRKELPSSSLAE
jgi:hypothetical protein